jgi:ankyrin repeat protein
MRQDIDQILSFKDKEGNTVLDLAVKRGQIKVIFLFICNV